MVNEPNQSKAEQTFQLLRNFQLTRETVTFGEFFNQIQTGKYESVVIVVRRYAAKGDWNRANAAKSTMPAVCVSGVFSGRRTLECLTRYLPYLPLDIDGLSSQLEAERLRDRAMKLPFAVMAFVTAKGRGVKLICRTPGNPEKLTGDALRNLHKSYYEALAGYYEKQLHCTIDRSGSDVTRTVLFSFDRGIRLAPAADGPLAPDRFFRTLSPEAEGRKPEGRERPTAAARPSDEEAFMLAQAELERQEVKYEEGNRNNYLYRLACKLNVLGVPQEVAEEKLVTHFGLPAKETAATVRSAYAGHRSEHGARCVEKRKKRTSSSNGEQAGLIEDYLRANYLLRYNVITRRLETAPAAGKAYEPLEDYTENSIFRDLCNQGFRCSHKNLGYLLRSDFVERFNPFHTYLESLPAWDGVTDHIDRLAATVTVSGTDDDNAEWRADFKRWFVAMVASWEQPGAVNQIALILVGKQGVYKTTWITSLLPPELRNYLYSGPFNPRDKDHILNLSRCALINCEELEELSGDRLNRFKSILTQNATNERAAYGRNTEYNVRCASFAGSTNQTELICDPTGMRRWLIAPVEQILSPFTTPVDYAGVYAQAYALQKSGFRYWSDAADVRRMNARNEVFEMKTVEEELVTAYFRLPAGEEPYLSLSAGQVMQALEGHTRVRLDKMAVGKALRKCRFASHILHGVRKYHVVALSREEVEAAKNV